MNIYATASNEPLPLSWIIAGGVIAVSFIAIVRWFASKYAEGVANKARVEFDKIPDFTAGPVHGFGNTALAYDERQNQLAAWRKGAGTQVLNSEKISRWFLGEVTKSTISRYDAIMLNSALSDSGSAATVRSQVNRIPYVILYEDDPAIPIFTVGFVTKQDMTPWDEILTKALGHQKRRSEA